MRMNVHYKLVGCRHWGVVVWIMAKGKTFFISSKVLFVLPRLLFSGYWQLCACEQSSLGMRLINYLHLVPRLRRSGAVLPPLLLMHLWYTWEIFTFSYECLEALLRVVSFGWWLHVSSMPASDLVISALRFWPGVWLSGLVSDFGRRSAVQIGFIFGPGDWLTGLLLDFGQWIGFKILTRRLAVQTGFRFWSGDWFLDFYW